MKLKINVTQQNIIKGRKYTSKSCPIALAFKEAGIKKVEVKNLQFLLRKSEDSIMYDLPRMARKFIRAFDEGRPVKPFSFNVKIDQI